MKLLIENWKKFVNEATVITPDQSGKPATGRARLGKMNFGCSLGDSGNV